MTFIQCSAVQYCLRFCICTQAIVSKLIDKVVLLSIQVVLQQHTQLMIFKCNNTITEKSSTKIQEILYNNY